jgi:hypothetical protein
VILVVNKNMKIFVDLIKVYSRQINLLLDYAEKNNCSKDRLNCATELLVKVRKSVSKLQEEHEQILRYINNSVKFNMLINPYQKESEKLQKEIHNLLEG